MTEFFGEARRDGQVVGHFIWLPEIKQVATGKLHKTQRDAWLNWSVNQPGKAASCRCNGGQRTAEWASCTMVAGRSIWVGMYCPVCNVVTEGLGIPSWVPEEWTAHDGRLMDGS